MFSGLEARELTEESCTPSQKRFYEKNFCMEDFCGENLVLINHSTTWKTTTMLILLGNTKEEKLFLVESRRS